MRLLLFLLASAHLWPQAPADTPLFSAASIRPSAPDEVYLAGATVVRGSRLIAIKATFKDLVAYAYLTHPDQIVGGPEWLSTMKFDIMAETEGDSKLTAPVARRMLQGLLADRFHFTFHPDRRQLPVYTLSANGPLKIAPSVGSPNSYGTYGLPMLGRMTINNATMSEFSNFLRYVLDRPVVDQTGINGRYDFQIDWTPDETQYFGRGNQLPRVSRAEEPPDIFTAFHEQLGLRLQSKRDLAPVFVIDHVETPTEN